MNILLTNDDGILAPGLWALFEALTELGSVTVVAPGTEQSGVGHAITYREGIRAERVLLNGQIEGYSITGTPADCVKFGLLALLDKPQDLVVSGINVGMNLGHNIFYSGTVAAALEGAMNGVLSVAFSTSAGNADRLDWAADHAVRTLKRILGGPRPCARAFNVNIPALNGQQPEIRFTRHRATRFNVWREAEEEVAREDCEPMASKEEQLLECDAYDVNAIEAGMISVTPLRADLTDTDSLRRLMPSEAPADVRTDGSGR